MPAPPKRKLGRPPLAPGETPAVVQVGVPPILYDKVYAIAQREGVSIPELARRGLARLPDPDE